MARAVTLGQAHTANEAGGWHTQGSRGAASTRGERRGGGGALVGAGRPTCVRRARQLLGSRVTAMKWPRNGHVTAM